MPHGKPFTIIKCRKIYYARFKLPNGSRSITKSNRSVIKDFRDNLSIKGYSGNSKKTVNTEIVDIYLFINSLCFALCPGISLSLLFNSVLIYVKWIKKNTAIWKKFAVFVYY